MRCENKQYILVLIMYREHTMCENKQYILVFNNVQGAYNEV